MTPSQEKKKLVRKKKKKKFHDKYVIYSVRQPLDPSNPQSREVPILSVLLIPAEKLNHSKTEFAMDFDMSSRHLLSLMKNGFHTTIPLDKNQSSTTQEKSGKTVDLPQEQEENSEKRDKTMQIEGEKENLKLESFEFQTVFYTVSCSTLFESKDKSDLEISKIFKFLIKYFRCKSKFRIHIILTKMDLINPHQVKLLQDSFQKACHQLNSSDSSSYLSFSFFSTKKVIYNSSIYFYPCPNRITNENQNTENSKFQMESTESIEIEDDEFDDNFSNIQFSKLPKFLSGRKTPVSSDHQLEFISDSVKTQLFWNYFLIVVSIDDTKYMLISAPSKSELKAPGETSSDFFDEEDEYGKCRSVKFVKYTQKNVQNVEHRLLWKYISISSKKKKDEVYIKDMYGHALDVRKITSSPKPKHQFSKRKKSQKNPEPKLESPYRVFLSTVFNPDSFTQKWMFKKSKNTMIITNSLYNFVCLTLLLPDPPQKNNEQIKAPEISLMPLRQGILVESQLFSFEFFFQPLDTKNKKSVFTYQAIREKIKKHKKKKGRIKNLYCCSCNDFFSCPIKCKNSMITELENGKFSCSKCLKSFQMPPFSSSLSLNSSLVNSFPEENMKSVLHLSLLNQFFSSLRKSYYSLSSSLTSLPHSFEKYQTLQLNSVLVSNSKSSKLSPSNLNTGVSGAIANLTLSSRANMWTLFSNSVNGNVNLLIPNKNFLFQPLNSLKESHKQFNLLKSCQEEVQDFTSLQLKILKVMNENLKYDRKISGLVSKLRTLVENAEYKKRSTKRFLLNAGKYAVVGLLVPGNPLINLGILGIFDYVKSTKEKQKMTELHQRINFKIFVYKQLIENSTTSLLMEVNKKIEEFKEIKSKLRLNFIIQEVESIIYN